MTAPQRLFRKVRRMGRIDSSVEGSRFRRGEHPRPPTGLDRGRNQQMTGGRFVCDGRMVSFVPGAQLKVQFIEQILRTLTVASDQRHTIRLRLPDLVE